MFDWEQHDKEAMEHEIKNISLAANYFLRAWYFGEEPKIEVRIFGNQVYIDSEHFEYLMIDLKAWIFALRAEEAIITAYTYKGYADTLVKIIEKVEKTMVNKLDILDVNDIIDSVKPKDPQKMN